MVNNIVLVGYQNALDIFDLNVLYLKSRKKMVSVTGLSKNIPEYLIDKCDDLDLAFSIELQESFKRLYEDCQRKLKKSNKLPLQQLRECVKQLIKIFFDKKDCVFNFPEGILGNYRFTHAFNVTVISLLMAKELKLKQELEDIAIGAFLHDIGYERLADDPTFKKKRLSRIDFEKIKKHPCLSAEILKENNINHNMPDVIYQHHERKNAKGYPKGVPEEKIHPFAFLISVADTFDAMTSPRPYRDKLKISLALEIIKVELIEEFPQWAIKLLLKIFPPLFNGCVVLLSNKQKGLVIKGNIDNPYRPTVRVFWDKEFLKQPFDLDLSKHKELFIVSTSL